MHPLIEGVGLDGDNIYEAFRVTSTFETENKDLGERSKGEASRIRQSLANGIPDRTC